MVGPFRSRRVPDDVASQLPAGDRALAWGRTCDGRPVAACAAGLTVEGAGLLGWHEITHVRWTDHVLRVDTMSSADAFVAAMDEVGRLPVVVMERVTASIVVNERHTLDGERGVRVLARRVAGEDELRWGAVLDPGLDPADPRWRTRVEHLVGAARARLGRS